MEKDKDSLPSVSVIIPAGRGEHLTQCLKSIFNQRYPKEKLEVVVVSPHQFEPAANVRFIKTRRLFYPGEMRNIGANLAQGDYLLFLDDDCEPLSNWIKTNISALKNKEIGAVSGMIFSKENNFWEKVYDFSNFDLCQTKKPCLRILSSATFGIRRDIFKSIGGFNERLRVVEDNDLCLRLNQCGYKTLYNPNIKVFHHHNKNSFSKIIKHMFFGGYNANLILIRRYPDFSFTSRGFLKTKNPFFYLVLVIPLSILNLLSCLRCNLKEHPKIIFLSPFIFLGKLSHHIGVLSALIRKNVNQN